MYANAAKIKHIGVCLFQRSRAEKMMKRLSLAVLCCLLLAGCIFDPVFDASSLFAYQNSLAAIKAKLSNDDQRRLDAAMKYLFLETSAKFAGQSPTSLVAQPNVVFNQNFMLARLAPKINGQSAVAVIQDLSLRLDAEISAAEATRQNLDNVGAVEIGSPGYYWRTSGRLEQPTVEFSVRNGTKVPVSRVYVRAVLISPGRSIPWAKQDFVQTFKGGLEPREKQQLTFEPRGGDWSDKQLKYLPNAELKVVVTNFEDASGQRVLPAGSDDLELKRKVRAMLQ
jgi:hypothetical protein